MSEGGGRSLFDVAGPLAFVARQQSMITSTSQGRLISVLCMSSYSMSYLILL